MLKTGGLKLMQKINQYNVLKTIREHGPLSKSEIAKKINLSPTTVASAVNELLKTEIVCLGDIGKSSGGRKPVYIQFAPNSKYLLGVSITNSKIEIAKINLNAEVREKETYSTSPRLNNMVSFVLDCISQYIFTNKDLNNCLGISIITPGIVDSKNGVIVNNAKLNLKNVPMKRLVEERFELNVWLENDANAIALAESKGGLYKGKESLIYIQLGDGLGCGITFEGTLFRGAKGGGGEFGHITIDKNGDSCECGNKGCLENYTSWPAISSKLLQQKQKGKKSILFEESEPNVNEITPVRFMYALKEKDVLAIEVFQETINYLSSGIVSLVNLFNPAIILIGWEGMTQESLFLTNIRAKVKEHAFEEFTEELEINWTSLGNNYQLKGAASIALKEIFKAPM